MIDPNMFFNQKPEGMDVFVHEDLPGTTRMTKLK